MPLDNDKLKGFQLIRNLGGPIILTAVFFLLIDDVLNFRVEISKKDIINNRHVLLRSDLFHRLVSELIEIEGM